MIKIYIKQVFASLIIFSIKFIFNYLTVLHWLLCTILWLLYIFLEQIETDPGRRGKKPHQDTLQVFGSESPKLTSSHWNYPGRCDE